MKQAVLIAFAACQPTAPPVVANVAAATKESRVPFAPCPMGTQGAIEHELFRGCAPAPFNEPLAPCPHGECPRPCRVQLGGGGTQTVTYDERGRLISAEGNEDRLLDQGCTYDGNRIAECHLLYEGRSTTTEKVWRDPAGHIIGTSNGEPMVGYDPHYTWANGHVVKLDSTMQQAEFKYAGDRLTEWSEGEMGETPTPVTYTYDNDGDVIANSRDGAYVYDSRKRLVAVGHARLEWDDRDRLIRSTIGQTIYTYTYECK